MSRSNFENLRVYQLSEEIADAIWEITVRWDSFDRDTIGKQIVKSADSVGANIAEGCGRFGIQDNKRFGFYARGSLNETKHWLRRAFKRKLLSQEEIEFLKPLLDELSPKLNAYIKSIKPRPDPVKVQATNHEQPSTN